MKRSRTDRRTVLAGMTALPLSLALSRTLPLAAQEASPAAGAEITITITAMDFSYEIPAEVSAGYVSMTMVNEGMEDHHGQLLRLNDDVTPDDFMAALMEGPEAIFPLVSFFGGVGIIPPGEQGTVIQQLTAGNYMILCFVESPDGVPHVAKGMIQPFTVVEGEAAAEEPAADIEVILVDFAFEGMPAEIPTGQQTWKITNEGPEPHELALIRLAEGMTVDMIMGMMMAEEASPEASPEMEMAPEATPEEGAMAGPPFSAAGGIQAMDAGMSGWLLLDLEPGEYAALCFVPSPANQGTPHAGLGMVQGFTVTEG